MANIRWNQDGEEPDAPNSGTVTPVQTPPPTAQPTITVGNPETPQPKTTPAPSAPPPSTQPGSGIPWATGADHPSANPPGYTWDTNQARFVPAPTTSGSGRTDQNAIRSQVQQWMQSNNPQGHQDAEYWVQRILQTGGLGSDNTAYWQGRFTEAPGTHQEGGPAIRGAGVDINAGYPENLFDDPGASLLESILRARLNELAAPVDDPSIGNLIAALTERVKQLQGPVFSDGEEEAMRTKLFDQTERDRQSRIKSAIERMAALGHGKTSGTITDAVEQVNRGFDSTRATQQNNLTTSMIDERQNRLNQALQLMSSIANVNQGTRDQEDSRRRELVSLASILEQMPQDRLQLAMAAAGNGSAPAPLANELISLQNAGINQQESAANRRAGLQTGLGQIVAQIIAGMGKKAVA
jgi:hypothetical protein